MKKIINVLVIIGAIPLLVLGVLSIFSPTYTFDHFGFIPNTILAYSTFRGNIGATLLSVGLIKILGLITKNKTWFHAAQLIVSVILFSRIVSIITDGWTSELTPVLITETFNIVVVYFALKQLNNTEK